MNITSNENNAQLPGILYVSSSIYLALVGFLGIGLNSTALAKLIKIIRVFFYFTLSIQFENYSLYDNPCWFYSIMFISEKKYRAKFYAHQSHFEWTRNFFSCNTTRSHRKYQSWNIGEWYVLLLTRFYSYIFW